MENKWYKGTLGDITEITMGQSPKGIDCNEIQDGVPLLNGPTEFSGWHPYPTQYTTDPKRFAKEDDLLFCVRGSTTGRMNWAEQQYAIGRGIAAFRHKLGKEYQAYLRALVEYKLPVLLQSATGSTFPNVSKNQLFDLEIDIPSAQDALSISKVISSLDNKIYLNQQTNQTLEQMAQTLFKSWFVDFDPVFDNLLTKANYQLENLPADFPEELHPKAVTRLAALNACIPSQEHENERLASGNDSDNAGLPHPNFPSEFEFNEQLGWVPLGWEASTTDNEFIVKGGSTPSTKNLDFWEGGHIHWTSPKDLSGNDTKIMLDTSRKITELGLTKITSGLLPIDTVLMSSRAPVGYLALAKVPVAINQGYIAITDAKTLTSEYTIQWLDSVMDEIKSISGGTTFAEISKKIFKSIQLVIPSKEVVEAYTKIAKANYERITANVQEINTLTETRDYLLPKLISGEIKLDDINHDRH